MPKARGLRLESIWIYVQAAVVGVGGGVLGVAFRKGVDIFQEFIMGPGAPMDVRLPAWQCVLFPTVGGFAAGLALLLVHNKRGPFGISDVIQLAVTRHGRIRPLHNLVHIISSGCSIASGGSIGREGANSQLGAMCASILGHRFPNSTRSRTVLLGCGIAAGIAGAYKAPIASAIFVMEVVLGNFAMDILAPLVVSSVISTLITVAAFSQNPLYRIGGDLALTDWRLVLSAAVLGGMCGFGGIAFRRTMEGGRRLFAALPLPLSLRMALGGLVVGVIGIWYPEVWGNGQVTIEVIADPKYLIGFAPLVALLVLKLVATASTAGSGALGGVFTPNLVVGAAFGAAFARVIEQFGGGDYHTHFALVGMCGMVAATAHAPITAILLIFEMTKDYGLILPLMLCSVVGSVVARLLDKDSIYTAKLRAAGHEMHTGLEEMAIHANYVRDVMRASFNAVPDTAPLDDILDLFNKSREGTIYVVDDSGLLMGLIQLHDVKQFINDPTLGSVVIAADLTRPSPVVHAEESLAQVIGRFDDPDLDELPVVDRAEQPRLMGRITRRDIVTCLSEEVLGQRSLRAKLKAPDREEATFVELPSESRLARLRVPPALVDRSLASLDLPDTAGLSVLVLVRHDDLGREERVFPLGTTVLHEDDHLVVLGHNDAIEAFQREHGLE